MAMIARRAARHAREVCFVPNVFTRSGSDQAERDRAASIYKTCCARGLIHSLVGAVFGSSGREQVAGAGGRQRPTPHAPACCAISTKICTNNLNFSSARGGE